ncbi:hypothetical protein FRB90_010106 [Tulasnella sp. 427]|nr:hypothetical protein FRB90_010106 [Tulasnella sp. 427]
MATTSGPTLVVRNPSEKSRHVPNAADERIESLKTSMESTIQGTNWPSESKAAAQAFVKTIKLSPGGPNDLSAISKELQDAYNEYLK